mgnify:CR=1 FL=1
MLNYHSPINKNKSYSGLTIKEVSPIMKLNLRGKSRDFLSTIGKNINMILPIESNTSSSSDKYTSMWLSPDEGMVVSNNTTYEGNNNYHTEKVKTALKSTNINYYLSKEILTTIWEKLIFISGLSGMTCITNSTFEEILSYRQTRHMTKSLITESYNVGTESGIKLNKSIIEDTMKYRITVQRWFDIFDFLFIFFFGQFFLFFVSYLMNGGGDLRMIVTGGHIDH